MFEKEAQVPVGQDNVQAFERLMDEGFGRGNLAVVDELMAPGCVEHQPRLGSGPEGVKAMIGQLHAAFENFECRVEQVVADGDFVWARSRGSGTQTGPLMGRPASNRRMEIDVFDLCRFEGGRIVEHWGVPDQLSMLMQIGAIPAPATPATPAAAAAVTT